MVVEEPDGFREFVQARSPALLRTAWMLTGDAATAEDLLQTALVRTWPHWGRIASGNPDAYVRTAMVRTNASWRARLWYRERPSADPEAGSAPARTTDDHARTRDRIVLTAALATLPTRQRQAVVLRYFDDLSVDEVASIMQSSTGTVKSQCAKGLTKLRAALGDATGDASVLQEETR